MAKGFGTGLASFAPGTFGSFVGVALFWVMAPLGAGTYVVVVVLFLAGIFICGQTARDTAAVDPGFNVYRVFDIWKPFPIPMVEEKLGLGTAIMADDVIAGIYTLLILQLARLILEKFGP